MSSDQKADAKAAEVAEAVKPAEAAKPAEATKAAEPTKAADAQKGHKVGCPWTEDICSAMGGCLGDAGSGEVGVSVAFDSDGKEDATILVSVVPPSSTIRTPTDLCCVIDTSGSMMAKATVGTEAGDLNILDIAKHAVLTTIHVLGDHDRLCIVEFSDTASVKLPLTYMNKAGRTAAEKALEKVVIAGGTQLWSGIACGLDALEKRTEKNRLAHMVVLTDGETENRDGVMGGIKAHKAKHERLPGTISAFGFGYSIDSRLLNEVASYCHGTYAFIPDAGFVGTIFVNSLANLLCTVAQDARLTLQADAGEISQVLGGWESVNAAGLVNVELGTLQTGQSKDIVVKMKVKEGAPKITASLSCSDGKNELKCVAELAAEATANPVSVSRHVSRAKLVDFVRQTMTDMHTAATASSKTRTTGGHDDELAARLQAVKDLAQEVSTSPASKEPAVVALLADMKGQCSEAVVKAEYWQKWGRHYLPSVAFAHQLQQCNNFKDPGVQVYGGKLFKELQDIGDAAFNKLPPPKPSSKSRGGHAAAGPVSMAFYNNCSAGCLDGDSRVQLSSGATKRIADLVKGDRLAAYNGSVGVVECLVEFQCADGMANLVQLSETLKLTPYHPIRLDGHWRFPSDLDTPVQVPCSSVFSLVLSGASSLMVDRIPVVSLGHGIVEGAAKHSYFGTQLVVNDLRKFQGYAAGHVCLGPQCVRRNPETNLICGFQPC